MKLKTDDQGNAVLSDGKPVYVHDDGQEVPVDVPGLFAKIPALNEEAKKHRLAAKDAADKLAAFEGMDADAARKALETVANLDAKKLVDAGEVEQLKANLSKSYQQKIDELTQQLNQRSQAMTDLQVRNAFAQSAFVRDRLNVPSDMAETFFRSHVAVDESGNVSVTGWDGQTILSRSKPGEPAAFDEAIEALVGQYPHRDAILKAGKPGSGATGGNGAAAGPGGNPSTWSQAQKLAYIKENGAEKFAALRMQHADNRRAGPAQE